MKPAAAAVGLYSAAFQDDLSKKYNLISSNKRKSVQPRRRQPPPHPHHSHSPSQHDHDHEDVYLDLIAPTLSQRLQLIEYTCLNPMEWSRIKEKRREKNKKTRKEEECVICQQGFAHSIQILLSCGHIFHDACFRSWERFQPKKSCPLCRQTGYQRIQTRVAHFEALQRAATIVQSLWRGFRERKRFQPIWEGHTPTDLGVRKRRLIRRISGGGIGAYNFTQAHSNNSLITTIRNGVEGLNDSLPKLHNPSDSITRLFENLDLRNFKAKEVIRQGVERSSVNIQVKKMMKKRPIDLLWDGVIEQCKRRERGGSQDCPICLGPIDFTANLKRSSFGSEIEAGDIIDEGGDRRLNSLALFSCSHYMHQACFQSYRRLMSGKDCPVCRAAKLKVKYL